MNKAIKLAVVEILEVERRLRAIEKVLGLLERDEKKTKISANEIL